MAKPYSNDLRRKFLQSYDRGKASLRELAEQYGVSLGWAKKISARRSRTGQVDLQPYHGGRKSRVTEDIRQWLRSQVRQQPDLTLSELRERLAHEQKTQLCVSTVWLALKALDLRFKKNHSTHANARRRKLSNGDKPGSKRSSR